jgi:hypothetical protein
MMIFALILAGLLLLVAIWSIRRQFTTLKRLRTENNIPSDDRSYLRNQAYRRLINGALLLGLAGMLSGAYLSGMEKQAEEIGKKKEANADGEKPPVAEETKDFLRLYSYYWIGTLILLFLVVSLAIVDLWATRRYAWQQLRRIQAEHRVVLERDLAMYRQQKANERMRGAH